MIDFTAFVPPTFRLTAQPTTTDDVIATSGVLFNDQISERNFPIAHAKELCQVEIQLVPPLDEFDEQGAIQLLHEANLERPRYEDAIRFSKQYAHVALPPDRRFILFPHEPWLSPEGRPMFLCFECHPDGPGLALTYADRRHDRRFYVAGARR